MRRMKFKPKLRDTMLANARALEFWAGAAPPEKAKAAEEFVASALAAIPPAPKRRATGVDIDSIHGTKRAAPRQLEAPVVKAIGELLAVHHRVLFAVRQNTGQASFEAASGRYQPIQFYRKLTHGKEVTITDFWGILKDGRMLAVEAKRPGWSMPGSPTDTEMAQANFLALVRNVGGIGIFATSADEVAAALA